LEPQKGQTHGDDLAAKGPYNDNGKQKRSSQVVCA
jgi:hypothetical protein